MTEEDFVEDVLSLVDSLVAAHWDGVYVPDTAHHREELINYLQNHFSSYCQSAIGHALQYTYREAEAAGDTRTVTVCKMIFNRARSIHDEQTNGKL